MIWLISMMRKLTIWLLLKFDATMNRMGIISLLPWKKIQKGIAETGVDVSSVGRWNHDMMADGEIFAEKQAKYKALLDAAIAVGT